MPRLFKEKDIVRYSLTGDTLVVCEVAECSIMLGHNMYYCEYKNGYGNWYLDDEIEPAEFGSNG